MIGNAKQESVWYLEQQPCLAAQKARTARNQTEGWRCKKADTDGQRHETMAAARCVRIPGCLFVCPWAGVTCLLSAAGQAPHMADGVNLVFQV